MAQFVLEILDGDRAGEVVSLAASLRIGRKPANDLVLADEKTSGVHAEIVPEGDRFVLRDLGSTNGTFLDGRRITEVVLSPGDAFMIGRVHLRFRADGDAGAGVAGDESMSLGRLDQQRLSAAKPKSSVALLLVLLVLAAGAGGYVWWRNQQTGGEGIAAAGHAHKRPLVVPDNRLLDAGNCESDQGWSLKLAGAPFAATARSHTGTGAFEAVAAAGGPDFAVAGTVAAVTVPANQDVQLAAHVRTEGGARIAARLRFFSSNEAMPFQFRTGTPLAEAADWQRIAVTLAVPPGADRCQVEIVAALPKGGSAAFDDVALTDATGAEALQRKPDEAAATLIGTGSSIAIRSEPPTLLALLPGSAPAGLGGLFEASQLVLSDLGAKVDVDGDSKGVSLKVEGCDAVQLVFPADSAGALLAQGEQGFGAVAVPGEFTTDAMLLGERTSRCLVTFWDQDAKPARAAVRAVTAKGECRFTVPCARIAFQLGFRKERTDAQEVLRAARGEAQQGRPGKALDQLRELARKWPHDVETLGQAGVLREELQATVAERLRAISADLDEADFFSTRGGFERVVRDLDEMRQTYGVQNLPDEDAVAAMQKRASERLQQIDGQRSADEKQRLLQMATSFEQAQKPDLAGLVKDYLKRH